jgi:hypothetical protein
MEYHSTRICIMRMVKAAAVMPKDCVINEKSRAMPACVIVNISITSASYHNSC